LNRELDYQRNELNNEEYNRLSEHEKNIRELEIENKEEEIKNKKEEIKLKKELNDLQKELEDEAIKRFIEIQDIIDERCGIDHPSTPTSFHDAIDIFIEEV
jgi:hypothetical protein